MALIKCIECNKEVSDRAKSCPHCGCPLDPEDNNDYKEEQKLNDLVEKLEKNNNKNDDSEQINDIDNENDMSTSKKIAIALVVVLFIVLMVWLGVESSNQMSNNTANSTNKTNSTFSVQYKEDPVTGEKHITGVNNKTTEEYADDFMGWLGFERTK